MGKIEITLYYRKEKDGTKGLDYEAIAEDFEDKLSNIVDVPVMCSVTEDVKYEDRVANDGGPGIEYDIPTDGLFQVHWPNGKLRYEWYYKDGKRADGVSRGWWPNGNLKQAISFKDGKWDGLYDERYQNGQHWRERTFSKGRLAGTWTEWYENGQMKSHGSWKVISVKDGIITHWHENGQIKSKEEYDADEYGVMQQKKEKII